MRGLLALLGLLASAAAAGAAEIEVRLHYLRQEVELPPTLSDLAEPPADEGLAGARLGRDDNMTTGGFLGHSYVLEETSVPPGGDLLAAARAALAGGAVLILDARAEAQLAVADLPEAAGGLLFNVSAPEVRLRSQDCRGNLLHTIPSHDMRSDALMQFLVQKRWTRLALIAGEHGEDLAFAAALKASVAKFQLDLRAEKTWAFDADMRRNASEEVPVFTQDLPEHDVVLVADEIGDFARYVIYNTWSPRPVAGSEGMRPVGWAPVLEQWGAAQLQNRFVALAGRPMGPKDYAAWAAVRSVGEAVTRTGDSAVPAIRDYLLSDAFELAGFKGRPMSYRTWNGQLRQPIPIAHAGGLVAMAPVEGFLHERSELDTLGLDAPESACTAFGG